MNPLVSIIIPVYNGSNYICEAIDSALAQTYENIEIIVVNDGSSDGGKTEELILSYGGKVRYISKPNGGVSSALNEGIRQMRGEYFSWLSHDDKYAPEKIERQVRLLGNCDKKTMCFCTVRHINENTEFISESRNMDLSDGVVMNSTEALYYSMKHTMNGCSMLVPKTAFDECGGFKEGMKYCQDILMWWTILLKGYSLAYTDYTGVHSRVHNAQLTNSNMDIYHSDALTIAREVVPLFVEISTKEQNILYAYAEGEAVHANKKTVKMCFEAAEKNNLFSPSQKLRLKSVLLYGCNLRPSIRKIYYRLKRTKH